VSRTKITWADVEHAIGRESQQRDLNLGWQAQHDLAGELLALHPNLTADHARRLVAAAVNGCPLVLTWANLGSDHQTTTTVNLTYLTVWGGPSSDRLRAAYWGFHHDVYLSRVTAVELPAVSYQ